MKPFSDLQVISVYMGTTVNLVEWWDTYKAAKAALTNTLQTTNIKTVAAKNGARLEVTTLSNEIELRRIRSIPELFNL